MTQANFAIFIFSISDTSFITFISKFVKFKAKVFFQLFQGPAVYPKLINKGYIISVTFKLHIFIDLLLIL